MSSCAADGHAWQMTAARQEVERQVEVGAMNTNNPAGLKSMVFQSMVFHDRVPLTARFEARIGSVIHPSERLESHEKRSRVPGAQASPRRAPLLVGL